MAIWYCSFIMYIGIYGPIYVMIRLWRALKEDSFNYKYEIQQKNSQKDAFACVGRSLPTTCDRYFRKALVVLTTRQLKYV